MFQRGRAWNCHKIVNRHYTDTEWARIIAAVWHTEEPSQARVVMAVKKVIRSERLGRDYGCVLRPIRIPSRETVLWLLSNLASERELTV
jgi:hypothetical protein